VEGQRNGQRGVTPRRTRRVLALASALALALAGCGSGNGNDSSDTNKPGAPKPATGFDGKTIKLGVITPLTGPAAVIGNPLTAGNQVYFDAVNAKGGIAGKYKVQLVQRDSRYDASAAVQAYAGMKDSVSMFVQVLGTHVVQALLPQLRTDNVLAAPASLDAAWVRERNLLPIGPTYSIEAINGVSYFVTEAGGRGAKICALYADNPYGESGLAGVKEAAAKLGFQLGATATFNTGDTDFTAQLGRLQGCQAVFLTALPNETAAILGTAARARFKTRWLGSSPTWTTAFASSPLAPYLTQAFWLVSFGTTWGDKSNPGMRQMMADVQQFKPHQRPDIYFTFGYAQALAAAAVLEKAVAQGSLSRDGIANALKNLGTLSFNGLMGPYQYGEPADRKPPRASTIFVVDVKAPGGLRVRQADYESAAARDYKLP